MRLVANDTVLGETLCEMHGMARRWQLWVGLAGAALVVGVAGPFGTYSTMGIPGRLGYWAVVVFTTFWLGYFASFAAASWAEALGISAPGAIGIGAGTASVPVTLWLAALHALVQADPFVQEVLRLFPYVLLVTIGIAFLYEAVERRNEAVPEAAPLPSEPEWLDRLPHALGRDLILLQAQDHYLRAETSAGETLLRETIRDAERELGDLGMRVHRSWWVSRRAIRSYRYRNGAPVVVLRTGREVPVGRSYRRPVQDRLQR